MEEIQALQNAADSVQLSGLQVHAKIFEDKRKSKRIKKHKKIYMRTLKLTHEEINLLLRALGIAEQQAAEIRKKYIDTLVSVRGVENLTETAKETDSLFELETKFADLLIDIKKGGKDV